MANIYSEVLDCWFVKICVTLQALGNSDGQYALIPDILYR